MKKYHLVAIVGTLALVANLLVPGLAFGQSQQGGTEQIGCPTEPVEADLSFKAVPDAINFNGLSSTADIQSDWDPNLPDDANLVRGPDHAGATNSMLGITDASNAGVPNCYGEKWSVTAKMTDLVNEADGTSKILASDIVMAVPAETQLNSDEITCNGTKAHLDYGVLACKIAGTPYVSVADPGGTVVLADAADLTAKATYADQPALNADVTILKHDCGVKFGSENTDFYVGSALYIYDGVKAYQPQGKYVGTITYSLSDDGACVAP